MTQHSIVLRDSSAVPAPPSASTSVLAKRLASSEVRREYESLVEYDIAENVVRLRRHRGLTQASLAHLLQTKQPAVARIEAGAANPRLETLKSLARALGARLRIRIEPEEFTFPEYPSWWDCLDIGFAMPADSVHLSFVGTVQPLATGEPFAGALFTLSGSQVAPIKALFTISSEDAQGAELIPSPTFVTGAEHA